VSYLWSTDETTQSITVTETGSYSVLVTKNGCTFSDEINVEEVPGLNIYTTEQLCSGVNNIIEAPYPAGSNFFWFTTEEPGRFTNPQESGVYNFSFTDEDGCYQEGSVAVELLENEPIVYIPNAFTPNGDGVNDVFRPSNTNLDEYKFTVFNRWGEVVFDTEDPNEFWLGEFEGGSESDKHYVQNSVYSYRITYSSFCNAESIEKTGHVTVIR
jgi:gliding motility-associated-like protein